MSATITDLANYRTKKLVEQGEKVRAAYDRAEAIALDDFIRNTGDGARPRVNFDILDAPAIVDEFTAEELEDLTSIFGETKDVS